MSIGGDDDTIVGEPSLGRVARTGQLDLAQWNELEQALTRSDRPRRMQVIALQLITEVAISLGLHELAIRALRKAVECGLMDIMWLRACPLFADIAHDPRWEAMRDEVARRAAAVLAAFHAASG